MAKYIEREAAIDHVYDCCLESKSCNLNCIKDIPAADVRPVVRGRWIEEPGHIPHCSVCGRYSDDADTGDAICCPFCGARMDGDANVQNWEKNHLRPTNMSGTKCEPCKPTQSECGDCEYIKDGDGDA